MIARWCLVVAPFVLLLTLSPAAAAAQTFWQLPQTTRTGNGDGGCWPHRMAIPVLDQDRAIRVDVFIDPPSEGAHLAFYPAGGNTFSSDLTRGERDTCKRSVGLGARSSKTYGSASACTRMALNDRSPMRCRQPISDRGRPALIRQRPSGRATTIESTGNHGFGAIPRRSST